MFFISVYDYYTVVYLGMQCHICSIQFSAVELLQNNLDFVKHLYFINTPINSHSLIGCISLFLTLLRPN